jgi:hypothetical protein
MYAPDVPRTTLWCDITVQTKRGRAECHRQCEYNNRVADSAVHEVASIFGCSVPGRSETGAYSKP